MDAVPPPPGSAWRRLRPEEVTLAVFGLGLAIFMAATGHAPATFAAPLWRVARRLHLYFAAAVLALMGALLARGGGKRRALAAVARDFAPFYAVMVLYEALHDLTPLLGRRLADPVLIRIDHAILGADAAVWIGRFASPALSWLMAACYGAYYVVPGLLAVAIYGAGRRALYRDFMLAGVLAAALGFAGYLLVPAVGPYVFQAELFPTRLPGGAYCPWFVRAVDDLRGVARDCFPSLHAAHATIVLVFAARFRRAMFLALLPVVAGLYLSTIYLRMHYVVDLLAGAATAGLATWAASAINRLWWNPDGATTSRGAR
jgi:membrane-associated phospholipid phosphatase